MSGAPLIYFYRSYYFSTNIVIVISYSLRSRNMRCNADDREHRRVIFTPKDISCLVGKSTRPKKKSVALGAGGGWV